jgi:beta-glucosidase
LIKNAGHDDGDEVAQVYLGAPKDQPSGVQFPVRKLAAFDRLSLGPGQTKNVHLHVPLRQLQYWSAARHEWMTALGARTIYVVSLSRNLHLEAETTIH